MTVCAAGPARRLASSRHQWRSVSAAIAACDAIAVETPTCIGLDPIRPDVIKPDAAKIDVPAFFGHGALDARRTCGARSNSSHHAPISRYLSCPALPIARLSPAHGTCSGNGCTDGSGGCSFSLKAHVALADR